MVSQEWAPAPARPRLITWRSIAAAGGVAAFFSILFISQHGQEQSKVMQSEVSRDLAGQLDLDRSDISVTISPFYFPVLNELRPTARISGLGDCALQVSTSYPEEDAPQLRLARDTASAPDTWQIMTLDTPEPTVIDTETLVEVIDEFCPQPNATVYTATQE